MSRQRIPRIGERVVALDFPGGDPLPNAMQGTVRKVTKGASRSGGNRAMLRVEWDNQHEGRTQERMVALVKQLN